MTNTARTTMQQLLVTEAAERALREVRWPGLQGGRVFVDVASPAAADDRQYLADAVASELAHAGAVPVAKAKQADVVAIVLAGALGTEQTGTFVGIPKMESVVLPLPVPEIAFFRSRRQEGYAKLELVLVDPKSGGVVYRDGPRSGSTYWSEYTFFLFGFYRTDTTREEPGLLDTVTTIPGDEPPPLPPRSEPVPVLASRPR